MGTHILSSNAKVKRIAEIIMRTIPYPMTLVFTLEDRRQIWTAHQRINKNDSAKNTIENFIHTDWLTEPCKLFDILDIMSMNMTNFYTLYCDIVDCISIYNARNIVQCDNMTGKRARELTARIAELDGQIAGLKVKLEKETQFNKRVEINMELKRLLNIREGVGVYKDL